MGKRNLSYVDGTDNPSVISLVEQLYIFNTIYSKFHFPFSILHMRTLWHHRLPPEDMKLRDEIQRFLVSENVLPILKKYSRWIIEEARRRLIRENIPIDKTQLRLRILDQIIDIMNWEVCLTRNYSQDLKNGIGTMIRILIGIAFSTKAPTDSKAIEELLIKVWMKQLRKDIFPNSRNGTILIEKYCKLVDTLLSEPWNPEYFDASREKRVCPARLIPIWRDFVRYIIGLTWSAFEWDVEKQEIIHKEWS